jgi:hypothetical protein
MCTAVGAKKYKRIYKSDNFNQTDYATDNGLYRYGDQAWPSRTQSQVRAEVVAPFAYAASLQGFMREAWSAPSAVTNFNAL